jgi:hypothetical protein
MACNSSIISPRISEELHAIKIIYLDYVSDWKGYVDIAVELKDHYIFTYRYKYGYDWGSDYWENRRLKKRQIKNIMINKSLLFPNKKQWQIYCAETHSKVA